MRFGRPLLFVEVISLGCGKSAPRSASVNGNLGAQADGAAVVVD
jgi:hypothetical protein